MKKTWCNTISIEFGSRIGEALADDLPEFALHLRITGELMNVHMWVSGTCYISNFSFILLDTHTTFVLTYKQDRLIDKDINETCNDFKGRGNNCLVYCETYFPFRVKIPITRILGGDRFDVVFEACLENYWNRQKLWSGFCTCFQCQKIIASFNVLFTSFYGMLRLLHS